MSETKKEQKIKIVEMAKKRRHIHLLEKMQRGKSETPALSKSEINELVQLESDPNSPGVVDSQEKVAKIFGVATRTVERWAKDGMPVTPEGLYDLIEIRAWRTVKNNRKDGKKGNRKDDADARYREAKASLAEIALREKLGELIAKDIIEKELIQISSGIKRALLGLPKQVAPQLEGLSARQIDALLTTRIKETIQAISDGKALMQRINAKNPGNIKTLDAISP